MASRILFFLLLITILLGACEKRGTTYIKRIDNQTSDTLNFYFLGIYNPATYGDTIIVSPNENKQILFFEEESGIVYNPQGCRIVNDSVRVAIKGGRRLLKDMRNESDWEYTEIGTEQTCTFRVIPSDIQ